MFTISKARNLIALPLCALALAACAGSSYDNNVMFGRVERALNANDVARERQAQTTSIRTNTLYGYYSDQDLRLNSFALFMCSAYPANPPASGVYTDAAIVPAGVVVQTGDVVVIERGGGRQPDGSTIPHRVVSVVKNEKHPDVKVDRINGVELPHCDQPAY